MARKPALTLILLTPHRVHRADFARPGDPPELSDIERPQDPDVPAAVEAALYSGTHPGKIVYVLATDFWIQTLAMPGNRVYGLPAAEVAQNGDASAVPRRAIRITECHVEYAGMEEQTYLKSGDPLIVRASFEVS